MASEPGFVEYVAAQVSGAGAVTWRKMFGEYALYVDGKVVGLICDNMLYVKPTEEGRAFIGTPEEAPAYPGARPSFLIGEGIDDSEWLTELFRITASSLPEPAPRRSKKSGGGR